MDKLFSIWGMSFETRVKNPFADIIQLRMGICINLSRRALPKLENHSILQFAHTAGVYSS